MTKPTLNQELRSLTAAVRAKYPKPAQDLVNCQKCGRHVPWTNDDWRGYQMAMTVEGISPRREPVAYSAMFDAFLLTIAAEHCPPVASA